MSRGCVLVIAMVSCAYPTGGPTDARVGDAAGDAVAGPCALPSLALQVATLAGCDSSGTADGSRELARFANPVNVAVAPSGLAYVADFDSARLRKLDATGKTTTILTTAKHPFGLALGRDGYLYVETDDDDLGAHSLTTGTIWKVDPATGAASVIARDVGRPRGITVLADGRIALADHQHDVVELLDPASGQVTLLAGQLDVAGHVNATGAAAQFAQPYDVVELDGDLIVTDLDNHVLRRVTLTGVVSDFAGTGVVGHDDGPATTATFGSPKGAAIDQTGAIYITDAANHDIREISGGTVSTIAGSTIAGWHDDDDPMQAMFYGVEGLDVSPDGHRLVVADGNVGDGMPYNRVRLVHH